MFAEAARELKRFAQSKALRKAVSDKSPELESEIL